MASVSTSVTGPRCVRPANRNTRSNSSRTMAAHTSNSGRNCMEACIRTFCISTVFGSMKTSRILSTFLFRRPLERSHKTYRTYRSYGNAPRKDEDASLKTRQRVNQTRYTRFQPNGDQKRRHAEEYGPHQKRYRGNHFAIIHILIVLICRVLAH